MFVIAAISVALFASLFIAIELGGLLARRLRPDKDGSGTAADAVLFAVLGLLIAFTFNTTASRYHERRELVVQQVNAVGTVWLRIDTLIAEDRASVRTPLQQWVAIAADTSRLSDASLRETTLRDADRFQRETWHRAIEAIERRGQPQLNSLILGPLNEWIDLSTKRVAMDDLGLPPLVLPTLLFLSVLSAVLAGFNMSRSAPCLIHKIAFAAAISFSIYVILDLSQPRDGFIRVDHMDLMFLHLNQMFEREA